MRGRGVIRFAWELLWLVIGALLIVFGVTGQTEGGAGYSIVSIIIGISVIGWSYWSYQSKKRVR